MKYTPAKKQTLLIPAGGVPHLFVFVTDRSKDGFHLAVNITTVRPRVGHDKTCEIRAGEHRFVSRLSFVMYGMAERLAHEEIVAHVESGRYTPHDPVSDDLFRRIYGGVLRSPHTKGWVRVYFRQVEGIKD